MIKLDTVIVVFIKSPSSLNKKTRLSRELGERDATYIYEILVDRTLAKVNSIDQVDSSLSLDSMDEEDLNWFSEKKLLWNWMIFQQKGSCLGEKMHNTFTYLFQFYRRVLMVGGDVADSTTEDLILALDQLKTPCDVVVGPSADGGFWCLGLFNTNLDLFKGLTWSKNSVFNGLKNNIEELGLNCKTISIRRDIDTCYDIGMVTLLS